MGPMKCTRIKKGTALFMILLAGAFLIMACGKKEESAGKDISMEELEEKLLAADSTWAFSSFMTRAASEGSFRRMTEISCAVP